MKNLKYILILTIILGLQPIIAQQAEDETAEVLETVSSNQKTTQEVQDENIVADASEQEEEEPKKSKWNVAYDLTLNSRFIWRGLVLGDHPNAQASVTFSNGGFFVGVWSSYPFAIASDAPNYKEIIPYIGYGGKVGEKSNLAVMVLPHYDPNVGGFFDFDNDGATNRLELRAIYNIGKLDFFAGWDFYNSFPGSDAPLYLEVGYSIEMPNKITVRPFISGSPNDNYYTTDEKANVTQIGWYTSKSYSISKEVGLTLKADMVYNPDREEFNAAFNATIKL
ncbi:TorF family putative porin [Aquimarina algicola]|uniref:Transporter n=1 Tax=Aquimarina algicola TaxID=2589995 RepID=A0A504JEH0_9FLAO|nr:TorF family putative porin [Aquimarina algicola]TPN87062.1 hypothetical protein FHK87_05575 [Aquimarina algicola]